MAAVGVSAIAALAGSGWLSSDPLAGALTAIAWLCVPFVAAGIGMGDAFFLRHGVGTRRVALTGLLGFLVSILGCVTLAVINTGDDGNELLSGALYFILVAGVIAMLSTGIAIAVGRASGYLSRQIQDVDDRGW